MCFDLGKPRGRKQDVDSEQSDTAASHSDQENDGKSGDETEFEQVVEEPIKKVAPQQGKSMRIIFISVKFNTF